MDATAPVTGRGGGFVVSRLVEERFRALGRSFAYELAGDCERLLGIRVEVRRDLVGDLVLSGSRQGSRWGRLEAFIRESPVRSRHYQQWYQLRQDMLAVLRADAIHATARPMTTMEADRLGGSPFGHSLATPGQVLVSGDAAHWRLVSRGGARYAPPIAIGARAADCVAKVFLIAHELGHDGQLRMVASLGEREIIRRVNGARAALGLPVRSERMPHSSLFVFPDESAEDDAISLFNYAHH